MKTYLLKIFNGTICTGLIASTLGLLIFMWYLLPSYSDNIPYLFIMFVVGFFIYISYKLSEGVISITLTVDDVFEIKNVEEPIVGNFKERNIKLTDIESYAFKFGKTSKSLILYLNDNQKIPTETTIWVAGVKPANLNFKDIIEKTPNGKLIVNEYSD